MLFMYMSFFVGYCFVCVLWLLQILFVHLFFFFGFFIFVELFVFIEVFITSFLCSVFLPMVFILYRVYTLFVYCDFQCFCFMFLFYYNIVYY